MASYEELLQKQEWKDKRKVILKRDANRCTICSNQVLVKDCLVGYVGKEEVKRLPISKVKKLTIYCFYLIGTSNQRMKWKDVVPIFGKLSSEEYDHYIVYYFNSREGLDYEIDEDVNLNPSFYRVVAVTTAANNESAAIYNRENNPYLTTSYLEATDWLYVQGLHIHHTYYQEGKMPWEYPNDALQTLCWNCHESLHENTKVPHLDVYGNEIGKLTPCSRCLGIGYFPQYKHVENGVCFKCRGMRYEEKIDNSALNIFNEPIGA